MTELMAVGRSEDNAVNYKEITKEEYMKEYSTT